MQKEPPPLFVMGQSLLQFVPTLEQALRGYWLWSAHVEFEKHSLKLATFPSEHVQTLFFKEAILPLQNMHEKFGLRVRLPMNEPAIYLHIFAFHFRFHFYREALLDRIREIKGDEEYYPVTDI